MARNLLRQPGIAPPPDNLIAGNLFPIKTMPVTLTAGSTYRRGDALGRVTATGFYALTDGTLTTGAQNLDAILCDDVDATEGTVNAAAYVTGEFNWRAMRFGSGTWEDYAFYAKQHSIFLKESPEYPEPVLSEPQTAEDLVALDRMWLSIGYGGQDSAVSVTQNVVLETTGAYGSTITWASSDTSVISVAAGTAGNVSRGTSDVTVILTATITQGGFTQTKVFELVVRGNS